MMKLLHLVSMAFLALSGQLAVDAAMPADTKRFYVIAVAGVVAVIWSIIYDVTDPTSV